MIDDDVNLVNVFRLVCESRGYEFHSAASAVQGLAAIEAVTKALYKVGLRIHPEKSKFAASTVEFLGVNVNAEGMQIHPAKLKAIQELSVPRNVHDLRATMGLLNFSRSFALNFSRLAAPLNALFRKDVTYLWGPEQQEAFDAIKRHMAECIILYHIKTGLPLRLYTDFSVKGLGALLTQFLPEPKADADE